MPILPAEGQPITYTQIQNYISTYYSVSSTSLRTLSDTDGLGAPDSLGEFYSYPITVFARNRFALTNDSNTISIRYQITPNLQPFNFITLRTQSIGTTYVNMGTFYVDRPQISTTNRLRIGCQHEQFGGGIINVPFGVGDGGTNWTTFCGLSTPYTLTALPTEATIWLNINVSSGQYPSCG